MKLSLQELKSAVADYVLSNKIAVDFQVTADNVAGLIDKIGVMFTLDGTYEDYLEMFDGFDLPYGKTIEEWFEDLIMPSAYDSTGANALAPSDPTYRPVSYSLTLGRKVFKTTRRYDNVERAVHNQQELVELITMIMKRLYDSFNLFKFGCKKQGLASLYEKVVSATYSNWSTSSAYSVNDLVKSGTSKGIVVKALASSHGKTFAEAVADGNVVVYDIVRELAIPTDTSSGEAWLKQVKKDYEQSRFAHEGSSLNGNTIGVGEDGLVLLVKKGIMPVIDVDVLAGAFHQDKVGAPVEIKVIDDFGVDSNDDPIDAYAILLDKRGMFFCNGYRAVREQVNADGDFINYYLHTENTLHISRNTFVKIYKPVGA